MALTVLRKSLPLTDPDVFGAFPTLDQKLRDLARDPVAMEFESVICYQNSHNTGVNFDGSSSAEKSIVAAVSSYKDAGGSAVLPLVDRVLNNFVVCTALSTATQSRKPSECTTVHGYTISERRRIFIQSNSTLVSASPHVADYRSVPKSDICRPSRQSSLHSRYGVSRI